MAFVANSLACSIFMTVLLFRGLLAPFARGGGGKHPKQQTEAERWVRPGWSGPHRRVTRAFRGARGASGSRRRAGRHAGTRPSRSEERRRASQVSDERREETLRRDSREKGGARLLTTLGRHGWRAAFWRGT